MEGQNVNALEQRVETDDEIDEAWNMAWEPACVTAECEDALPAIMPNGDPSSLTLWGDDA
jgi:hypothetical protein